MLIDLRVYKYLPGKFHKFLRSYEQFGFPLTSRHLGKTLGIFTSESGVQNETIGYSSPRRGAVPRFYGSQPTAAEKIGIPTRRSRPAMQVCAHFKAPLGHL